MGRLPAEMRALTPAETALLVTAWNEAQGEGPLPAAPTAAQMDDLKRRYPDG
ncbi:hypothetical protein DFP88_11123 [Pseudoroseicyclus aestuarii]|uniref:Uncharacterized protein n=2 Tax=Pseudoroseicyclus aestuarii TaxID=1795041 RepID=A0A318SLY8_9RHOB|nr:hypothetical protein DFP88_11123 [Pseudoroseicyclus aestuarii]